ncbi:hypothetical protein FRC03_004707 [Tulasnella sp. 419]|nr:hypothetical protein FRC03_004707 [Tulasnella sp. 419]
MSPSRTSTPKAARQTATVVFLYGKRRILIPRPVTYNVCGVPVQTAHPCKTDYPFPSNAFNSARSCIPRISRNGLRILAKIPDCPDGVKEETEITPEAWSLVASGINQFKIIEACDETSDDEEATY